MREYTLEDRARFLSAIEELEAQKRATLDHLKVIRKTISAFRELLAMTPGPDAAQAAVAHDG